MAQDQLTKNPLEPISLKDVGVALVKYLGLHEGQFDVSIEFKIAVGQVGPAQDPLLPGAILGISRIGLAEAKTMGPNTVDASEVNPLPPKSRRSMVKNELVPKKPPKAKSKEKLAP